MTSAEQAPTPGSGVGGPWPTEAEWRRTVPARVADAVERWDLRPGRTMTGGSVSHVLAVETPDGDSAVLKVSFPHREARDEGAALRWWDGSGAIRLLAQAPDDPFVLLLERCTPGARLGDRQDLAPEHRLAIGSDVLARLWAHGVPDPAEHRFERLVDVADEWADLVEERMRVLAPPIDPGVVRHGVDLLRALPRDAPAGVVLHGDHNPGNVLTAGREPWLAIDPKPMTGDPGYDLCPLLMQVDDPFERADDVTATLRERIRLAADRSGAPADRIAAWCVARHVEWALWYTSRSEPAEAQDCVHRAQVIAEMLD